MRRPRQRQLKTAALLISAERGLAKLVRLLLLDASLDADFALGSGGHTALHLAVRGDQTAVLQLLVDRQTQLDARNSNGETALWIAAALGRSRLVELLAGAQAQVDTAASSGESPLHVAARNGHLTTVRVLLARGAAPDPGLPESCATPLLCVCARQPAAESDRIAEVLITAGADVNARTSVNGRSPLSYACAGTCGPRLLEALIAGLADANVVCGPSGETPLTLAAQLGRSDVVHRLLQAGGADSSLPSADGHTTPLLSACRSGFAQLARLLIAAGAGPDLADAFGYTPLILAAELGHVEVMKVLLDAQADLDAKQLNGASAVFLAAQNLRMSALQMLVEAQANVDGQTQFGHTPLLAATRHRAKKVVSRLVKAQADVNLSEHRHRSCPLHMAAETGSVRIIELLASALGANVDVREKHGATPLYLAARHGHLEAVKSLVLAGACVDAQTFTGMSTITAVVKHETLCSQSVLDILVKVPASLDAQNLDGTAAIHLAVEYDRQWALNLLVAAGVNANTCDATGASALHLAAGYGRVAMVTKLLRAGADVDAANFAGSTPLALASEAGHWSVVSALTRAQANPEIQRRSGCSPMHLAAQFGHLGPVCQLIGCQASLDLKSNRGATPIYLAAQNGHADTVAALAGAQADTDAALLGGFTPLFVASQNGHVDIVRRLLLAGSCTDQQAASSGATALFIATQFRRASVVEALVRASADVNLRRRVTGETALHIAARVGEEKIARMLIAALADVDTRAADGATPYRVALSGGRLRVAKALLAAQATAAATVSDGTPHLKGARTPQRMRLRSPAVPDSDFSLDLHARLLEAGFHRHAASIQSAIADVTERLINSRMTDRHFIVGSFSEGWGSCLTRLNGRTDLDSNVNLVRLVSGYVWHIRGACQCVATTTNPVLKLVNALNGHLSCSSEDCPDLHPSQSTPASANRPAVHLTTAIACCSYPSINFVGPETQVSTRLADCVLLGLKKDLLTSICHAVPTGDTTSRLRLSTAFLEKRIIRNLSTVQGQLFVLLKFIVKRILSRTVKGLHSYLAKVLIFQMLDRTPKSEWQPEKLLCLTRRALRMLQDSLVNDGVPDNGCATISHFLLPNTFVQLGADPLSAADMHKAVGALLQDLPWQLDAMAAGLQPMAEQRQFMCHPFLIMPDVTSPGVNCSDGITKYHQLYDAVKRLLVCLAGDQSSLKALLSSIDALPDCARTAAETLRALAFLRAGDSSRAKKTVKRCFTGGRPCRGFACPDDLSAGPQASSFVRQHLVATDSAWKFCFRFEPPTPRFHFLPDFARQIFPLQLTGDLVIVNFDAFMKCLHWELLPEKEWPNEWFEELLGRDASDEQELLITLQYCRSSNIVKKIIEDNEDLIGHSLAAQEAKSRALQRQAHERLQKAEALAQDLTRYLGRQQREPQG